MSITAGTTSVELKPNNIMSWGNTILCMAMGRTLSKIMPSPITITGETLSFFTNCNMTR